MMLLDTTSEPEAATSMRQIIDECNRILNEQAAKQRAAFA